VRFLPHQHDYDMEFPPSAQGPMSWKFSCSCGKTVYSQEAALEDERWSRLSRRLAFFGYGIILGTVFANVVLPPIIAAITK
jgi:hypothetical protein